MSYLNFKSSQVFVLSADGLSRQCDMREAHEIIKGKVSTVDIGGQLFKIKDVIVSFKNLVKIKT